MTLFLFVLIELAAQRAGIGSREFDDWFSSVERAHALAWLWGDEVR